MSGSNQRMTPGQQIGAITALGKNVLQQEREERALVADNVRRLRACPGPHKFGPIKVVIVPGQDQGLADHSVKCSKCGGIASADQYAFYLMGLQHGYSHGRANRPLHDPDQRLAGAEDEHGPDGGRGGPGGGGGAGQPAGEHPG